MMSIPTMLVTFCTILSLSLLYVMLYSHLTFYQCRRSQTFPFLGVFLWFLVLSYYFCRNTVSLALLEHVIVSYLHFFLWNFLHNLSLMYFICHSCYHVFVILVLTYGNLADSLHRCHSCFFFFLSSSFLIFPQ